VLKNDYDKKSQNPETHPGNTADNDNNEHTSGKNGEPLRFVAPTHGGVDILKLLTELEDLVENTKHGPFGILLGFNEDAFHMTIMKIRANLPEEMKRASKLARDSERIVEETRANAEKLLTEARQSVNVDYERAQVEATRLREATLKETARIQETVEAELARKRKAAEEEAERIVAEARQEGEAELADARLRAEQLVEDSEIVQMAQALAQDIRTRAEEEATATRQGGDAYAHDVLERLEHILDGAVTQIQHGRELLERDL